MSAQETFVQNVKAGNWAAAADQLNGSAMFDILPFLAALGADGAISANNIGGLLRKRGWYGSAQRIEWAGEIVRTRRVPNPPPDLPADQVKDAREFLARSNGTAPKVARTGPQLGNDGAIPSPFVGTVRSAIDTAWKLNDKPEFIAAFNDVLSKLTGKPAASNAYALALNKMILNLADTSTNAMVRKTIADDAIDVKQKAVRGATPAMSERNGRNVWLRRFSLEKGVNAVVANIFHEALHLAGAPGDPIAEFGIEKLHKVAGFPR